MEIDCDTLQVAMLALRYEKGRGLQLKDMLDVHIGHMKVFMCAALYQA